MAFRRRRRKQRVQWFPPLGVDFTVGDTNFNVGFDTFEVQVRADGTENQLELPLTFDFGTEEILNFASVNIPTQTLSDLQGAGWRLRRAVGKVFACYQPGGFADNVFTGINDAPPACIFAAGLMVRRVSGAASNTGGNVTLFGRDDYTDPWIWRRAWILGQDAKWTKFGPFGDAAPLNFSERPIGRFAFGDQASFAQFPNTTAKYAGLHDGSHLDAKTNRVISTDERLFMHLSTKALPIQPQAGYVTNGSVKGVFDLRLLGGLTRVTNKRNASR